jgi:hypothetical protein
VLGAVVAFAVDMVVVGVVYVRNVAMNNTRRQDWRFAIAHVGRHRTMPTILEEWG